MHARIDAVGFEASLDVRAAGETAWSRETDAGAASLPSVSASPTWPSHTESGLGRFVEHPLERHVRDARAVRIGRVAAADVAVTAGEPDLLEIDARVGLPKGGLEVLPLFVDGERVARRADVAAHAVVVELVVAVKEAQEAERDAQRADRVPDADEVHLARRVAVLLAEGLLPRHRWGGAPVPGACRFARLGR